MECAYCSYVNPAPPNTVDAAYVKMLKTQLADLRKATDQEFKKRDTRATVVKEQEQALAKKHAELKETRRRLKDAEKADAVQRRLIETLRTQVADLTDEVQNYAVLNNQLLAGQAALIARLEMLK